MDFDDGLFNNPDDGDFLGGTSFDLSDHHHAWQLTAMGLLIEVFGVSIMPDRERGWTLEKPFPWKLILNPIPSGSIAVYAREAILKYCHDFDIRAEGLSEEEGGTSLDGDLPGLLDDLELGFD